jgi:hypothetical protein
MPLFIGQQGFKQLHRNIVANLVAMRPGLFIERAGFLFRCHIAVKRFAWCLADPQRVQLLQVGIGPQKDNTGDQLVGVVHLFDAFFAAFLAMRPRPPIPPEGGNAANTG